MPFALLCVALKVIRTPEQCHKEYSIVTCALRMVSFHEVPKADFLFITGVNTFGIIVSQSRFPSPFYRLRVLLTSTSRPSAPHARYMGTQTTHGMVPRRTFLGTCYVKTMTLIA